MYAAYEKLVLILQVNKKKLAWRRHLNKLNKKQRKKTNLKIGFGPDGDEGENQEDQEEEEEEEDDENEIENESNQSLPFFSIIKMVRFSNLK